MKTRAKKTGPLFRLAVLFCAAALLSPLSASAQAQSNDTPRSGVFKNDLFKARELRGQKNWAGLQAHALDWARNDPAEWRAWRFLGEAERELGRLAAAVDAFTKAEASRPPVRGGVKEDDTLLLAVADLQAKSGLNLQAENSYLLALKKNEGNTETWRKLTDLRVLMAENDPLRHRVAADSLERLMAFPRFINDYARWRKYAELLDGLGDDEKARAAYVHSVRLTPADAAAWERIVLYDLAAGRRDSALSGMRSLLRADPANVVANAYLGEKALTEGFTDDAKAHFQKVAAAQSGNTDARTKAYVHLIEMAETKADKLRLHKAALRVNPSLWDSWDYVHRQLRPNNRKAADALFRNKRKVRGLLAKGEPVPPELLP